MPEEGRVEAFEFPQFKAWFCEDVVAEWRGYFFIAEVVGTQDKFNDEQICDPMG